MREYVKGIVGIAVLGLSVSTVTAGTLGLVGTPTGQFDTVNNLSRLSIGASYQRQERKVWLEDGSPAELRVRQSMAHIGIDVTDWISVALAIGASSPVLDDGPSLDDRTTVYGCGARVSLFDHEVTAPELLAGRWSILGEGQYLYHEADAPSKTLDWREWYFDVQLRYQLFSFDMGEDLTRCPYGIALYAGPAWSHLQGEFDSRQHAGLLGGVDIFLTRDLAVGGEIQVFEKETYAAKMSYHF